MVRLGRHCDLGLFFHCYPLNSVQSLHMHMVDLNHKGRKSFEYQILGSLDPKASTAVMYASTENDTPFIAQ